MMDQEELGLILTLVNALTKIIEKFLGAPDKKYKIK